jgi:hypothetical protein
MSTNPNSKDPLKAYKKAKLKMLEHFCIEVTFDIKYDINHKTSEISIDNYCRTLMNKHLGTL